jgi:putative transposase
MAQSRDSLYRRHRFPAEVIGYAVWLYYRFPLSLRMVEEMLAARGMKVSHESVRSWAEKFGIEFSNRLRRSAPARGDKWRLDEVVITMRGKKHCSGAPSIRMVSCSTFLCRADGIGPQHNG